VDIGSSRTAGKSLLFTGFFPSAVIVRDADSAYKMRMSQVRDTGGS
jgi:hypothetical protein